MRLELNSSFGNERLRQTIQEARPLPLISDSGEPFLNLSRRISSSGSLSEPLERADIETREELVQIVPELQTLLRSLPNLAEIIVENTILDKIDLDHFIFDFPKETYLLRIILLKILERYRELSYSLPDIKNSENIIQFPRKATPSADHALILAEVYRITTDNVLSFLRTREGIAQLLKEIEF